MHSFEHNNHKVNTIPDAHAAITHKLGFMPVESLVSVTFDEQFHPVWSSHYPFDKDMRQPDVAGGLAEVLKGSPNVKHIMLAVYASGEEASSTAMSWLMALREHVSKTQCNVIGMVHFDVEAKTYETFGDDNPTTGSLDEPLDGYPHPPLTVTEAELNLRFELDEPIPFDSSVMVTKEDVLRVLDTSWGMWTPEDVNLLAVAVKSKVAARRAMLRRTLEQSEFVTNGWAYMIRKVDDCETRGHFGAMTAVGDIMLGNLNPAHRALYATACAGHPNQLASMTLHVLQHLYGMDFSYQEKVKESYDAILAQTAQWDDAWDGDQ